MGYMENMGKNKMKVKCKICGVKGHWDMDKISEFWASRFLVLHSFSTKPDGNIKFICRDCVSKVLDSLKSESYNIKKLYEPEIKYKENKK